MIPLLTVALRLPLQMKTKTKKETIPLEKHRITYDLHRTDRRNLRIIIEPDLSINMYVPRNATSEDIDAAILKKSKWIEKTLTKVKNYHPLPSPKQYISGETFIYLGRRYRLKIIKGSQKDVKLSGKFLHVSLPNYRNREKIKKQVDTWYREHAKVAFDRYFYKCYAIAARHGIPKPTLYIRSMQRRWGSCSVSGRITLNTNLVKAPSHCIEYVIMHELCHLKHHNHSSSFYRLLTRCQPDWQNRKQTLNQFKLC